MRDQLESFGIAEPDVRVEGENIIVDLPGVSDQSEAFDALKVSGIVELRPVLQCQAGSLGDTSTSVPGSSVPTGSSVPSATTVPSAERDAGGRERGRLRRGRWVDVRTRAAADPRRHARQHDAGDADHHDAATHAHDGRTDRRADVADHDHPRRDHPARHHGAGHPADRRRHPDLPRRAGGRHR